MEKLKWNKECPDSIGNMSRLIIDILFLHLSLGCHRLSVRFCFRMIANQIHTRIDVTYDPYEDTIDFLKLPNSCNVRAFCSGLYDNTTVTQVEGMISLFILFCLVRLNEANVVVGAKRFMSPHFLLEPGGSSCYSLR